MSKPARPPTRPREAEIGDFLTYRSDKVVLTECPICALDPERDPYIFDWEENRNTHLGEHEPGDVGQSLEELNPAFASDGGDGRGA